MVSFCNTISLYLPPLKISDKSFDRGPGFTVEYSPKILTGKSRFSDFPALIASFPATVVTTLSVIPAANLVEPKPPVSRPTMSETSFPPFK